MQGEIVSIIDAEDYRSIKSRYEKENQKLMRDKVMLQDIGGNGKYLKGCVAYLKDLDNIYLKATMPLKKLMVSSIFEGKLVYGENGFRTPKYTPVVEYITLKNNDLENDETGMPKKNLQHYGMVVPAGIEPASSESESEILSIVLRNHSKNNAQPAVKNFAACVKQRKGNGK